MAKKKDKPLNLIEEAQKEFDVWKEENPVLETRYVVLEKEKIWYDNDYGDEHGGRLRQQFNFETIDERMDWMAEHDPDEGCEFIKQTQYLRLVTPKPYKDWFIY